MKERNDYKKEAHKNDKNKKIRKLKNMKVQEIHEDMIQILTEDSGNATEDDSLSAW